MTEIWYRYDDPWAAGEAPFLQEMHVARRTAKCVVFNDYGIEASECLAVAEKIARGEAHASKPWFSFGDAA